jgi:choice-of-anchor A domain-containing protein
VAGGEVTLANGSISGDVTYGVPSTIPQTVTVSGRKSQQPFDVEDAFLGLAEVASSFASAATTGTTQSTNGTVVLTGTNAALNVFRVAASVLRQTTSIQIKVPNGAGAVIDVTGANVQLQNMGISVQGATPATLLWNFAHADTLSISSVSLTGAVLAPLARLSFDSGSINGTVVARSFTSSGSGSLQYTALNAPLLFSTPASSSSVALMPAQPLARGCTYQFSIPSNTALTSSNACLNVPLSVTFRVSKDRTAPADRELVDTQLDSATKTLGLLVARAGINAPVLEALARYEAAIGVSVADLVAGPPKPSFISRTQPVTAYQQVSQGYSVSGYGYTVSSQNGLFRSAVGRLAPALPVFPTTSVTQASALQTVLSSLHISQAPWVAQPASFHAPVGVLVILPVKQFPTSSDFKLVWSFRFGLGTGISDPLEAQVDAAAGTIVARTPGFIAATPVPTFDPSAAVYVPPPQVVQVDTSTANGLQPFTAVQYRQSTNLFATPATGDIAAPGVIATSIDFVGQGSPLDFKYVQGPATVSPWTLASSGTWQVNVASAQWALELADRFMVGLGMQAGGVPWAHIDGPAAQQQILATCEVNPIPIVSSDHYVPGLSDATHARLLLEAYPTLSVAPDAVAHEYGHALVDSMRRGAGMQSLGDPRDSGSINEGVADLFGLAGANFDLLSGPWYCLEDPTGHHLPCLRNIADPHSSGNPAAYLEPPYFKDDSALPLSSCVPDGLPNANDDCDIHLNSTVISHWGYLLAVGAAQGTGACNLTFAPLDPDLKVSLKIMLNIALRAMTLTAVSDKNDPNVSFQGFRDATVLAAQALQDESVYLGHDNLVKAVKLAWDAVALPPDSSSSSSADGLSPPDNSEGVGPWVPFMWPTSGLGQASPSAAASWDFQLASSPAFDAASIKYSSAVTKPITDTTNQDGKTLAVFKLSLPYTPSAKFYWRVRPHSTTAAWAACYPIHSFTTTGLQPEIAEITFPFWQTDSVPPLLRPGSVIPRWDPVAGAASYQLFLSSTVDPDCQSGGDVVQKPFVNSPSGGDSLDDIQPGAHYFVSVLPAGPPDFAGNPTVGACTKAEFTTAAMRAPQFSNPPDQGDLFEPSLNPNNGVFPLDGTTPPYFVWDALDGPNKYRLEFQEIIPGPDGVNVNGTCSPTIDDSLTEVITDPCSTSICRKQLIGQAFAGRNPSGYCVRITSIATNETESPPSDPSRFFFKYHRFTAIAPGATIGDSALANVSSIVTSGYGKDVTFSWQPDANATQYGLEVAPWPLNLAGAFDPRNCAFASQPAGSRAPVEDQTGVPCGDRSAKPMFRELVPTNSATISADDAGKGRYCWWAFPVTGNETDRQAMVDVFPQFCYRTGPDKPIITFDTANWSDKFTTTPITGRITTGYVPDGQFDVSGSPAGTFQFNFDKCKADSAQAVYNDIYSCDVEFTVIPQPSTTYTVTATTWNSDQHPPVEDASTIQAPVVGQFSTSECGKNGDGCCAGGVCKEANNYCDFSGGGGGVCDACGTYSSACCPSAQGAECKPAFTAVHAATGCYCKCGDPGTKCCDSAAGPCDTNFSLPTCQNGQCVAKPQCPLAQPLGPTFFLSPHVTDFANNLPSDCFETPSSVVDPKDSSFHTFFINCPESTFQNAVSNGLIPKFPTINISWAIVSGAVGYRVSLSKVTSGFDSGINFTDIDQGNSNYSAPVAPGIYSLTVRALDGCMNYGSSSQTAVVSVGP